MFSLLLTEETPGSGGKDVGSNSKVDDSKPFLPSPCYNNNNIVSQEITPCHHSMKI